MRNMSKISGCDVTECSYNINSQCHTLAITVGDAGGECAMCDTYVDMPLKGGGMDITGGVGACKVDDCQYNESLECAANSIKVGKHQGHPDCMTFEPR